MQDKVPMQLIQKNLELSIKLNVLKQGIPLGTAKCTLYACYSSLNLPRNIPMLHYEMCVHDRVNHDKKKYR